VYSDTFCANVKPDRDFVFQEAVSDKLTGVKTLSDVIGVENVHDFEYTVSQ
jgi:hypothetical protein